MDNLQPVMLNNSNGGEDWRKHNATAEKVYGRHIKTKEGSEKLYEITDNDLIRIIDTGKVFKIKQ